MEDNLLIEDTLYWKIAFGGRCTVMEDDLRRKMTFDGRWRLMEALNSTI